MSEARKLFIACMGREPLDDAELAESMGRAHSFIEALDRKDPSVIRFVNDCMRLFGHDLAAPMQFVISPPAPYTHDDCPWLHSGVGRR